jgi:peroxiredoxin
VPQAAVVTVLVVVRLGLLTVFAVAGVNKVAAPARTRRALVQFDVPPGWVKVLAVALPLSELTVAFGLAARDTIHTAAAVALGLIVLFTAAAALRLAQGVRPECGCFGVIHPGRIGISTIMRNLAMAAAAALLLAAAPDLSFAPSAPAGGGARAMDIVLALGLGTGLLGLTFLVLRRARRTRAGCAQPGRRPGISWQNRPAMRTAGLPLGTRAPRFALPGLDGGTVSLERLAQGGRSALVVFASASCGQCEAVLPAAARLQESRAGQLGVALICAGEATAARRLAAAAAIRIAAADERAQLAGLFRVGGVPSAVLVAADGTIASETASGVAAVTALVTRLAHLDATRSGLD